MDGFHLTDGVNLVTIICAVGVVVIWAVRNEGKLIALKDEMIAFSQDLEKLENKHEALNTKLMEKWSEIERVIYRIEGRLGGEGRNNDGRGNKP